LQEALHQKRNLCDLSCEGMVTPRQLASTMF
jgi:hypothetical protein